MAPRPTAYRLYCTTCKDYELHTAEPHICKECQTSYNPLELSDIPEDLVLAQRERYKETKRKNNKMAANMAYIGMATGSFFSPMESEYSLQVIEDDAGQKVIDKARKEVEDEIYRLKKIEYEKQQALKIQYAGTQRNARCPCGSGLKYKKCCLPKIETY